MEVLTLLGPLVGGVGVNLLAEILQKIVSGEHGATERLDRAKREYQESVVDFTTPLERKRQQLLAELTDLQAEVMLTVSNQALLLRILLLLLELTTEAYQATTEQALKFTELGLGRIRGTLEQYRKAERSRTRARTIAVVVSVLALIGLGFLIYWGTLPNGPSVDDLLPIIQLPLPVLIWSTIGSFTAILYRFNKSGDVELQDPLRWLFTRPLTGIVMGTIAYFVLKVGFLSVVPNENMAIGSSEVLWLVAFIGGFSDRVADGVLKVLAGRFGFDNSAELVSLEPVTPSFPTSTIEGLQSLVDNFPLISKWTRQKKRSSEEFVTEGGDARGTEVVETVSTEHTVDSGDMESDEAVATNMESDNSQPPEKVSEQASDTVS